MKQDETVTDPQTPEQWQEAVDAAQFSLYIDSCVQYGLIKMVPLDENGKNTKRWWYKDSGVNVDRCLQIIEKGKTLGYEPMPFEKLLEKIK